MDTGRIGVEVCVEGLEGLRAARAAGARRVELCCALAEGGLTPSAGAVEACMAEGAIELVVLGRPRGGAFVYSAEELAVAERDVELARERGAAGVALGCLTAEGEVDVEGTARLMARARPLAVAFHRAFDHVREWEAALEVLVRLGVERVLTSGQAASAFEGRERIGALVHQARGRIAVVAAGGVRPDNARELVRASGVGELHLSAAVRRPSAARFRNARVRLGRSGEAAGAALELEEVWRTDEACVRALLDVLRA